MYLFPLGSFAALACITGCALGSPLVIDREWNAFDNDHGHGCHTFDYQHQEKWPELHFESRQCASGHHQSPIDLSNAPWSTLHKPSFAFPGGHSVDGWVFNRCFGPEWNPKAQAHAPALHFDGQAYSLLQWHTHTPSSEHAVIGGRTAGEIHFVFGDGSGPKAVFGVPLVHGGYSNFFSSVLGNGSLAWPGVKDPYTRIEIALNFSEFFNDAHTNKYWTYSGSLTTPNCTEGIRWFISGFKHPMSDQEFTRLNDVSIDSVRDLQKIDRQFVDSSLDDGQRVRHEDM
ncbi:Alpha carbonic anhydrase 4 [Cercospora beticola]|uniref:Alpha carbonic anhydrase 4 n=1 Tax=Cercospora beticola TaxID=122368 RepID=A0A2G5HRF0_CERBT|nr:Alpha carbonic anhydrase 4 [Cercospora beticola]PIA95121.1 Alpha carbonic anhydrase 4 [Cercospora beticola]WPB05276.1 hypothetical protein RHO25_009928 [Cercospora beticola]